MVLTPLFLTGISVLSMAVATLSNNTNTENAAEEKTVHLPTPLCSSPPITLEEILNPMTKLDPACAAREITTEEFATLLLEERNHIRDLIIGEFTWGFSHGCIHIPPLVAKLLIEYGVRSGTPVIIYREYESPQTPNLPLLKPLSPGEKAYAQKIEVYPGAQIGVITYIKNNKREQAYFRVQCGVQYVRMGADGHLAAPTVSSRTRSYYIRLTGMIRELNQYYCSNLVGGAEIKFVKKGKAETLTLQYRTSPYGKWKDFKTDTPNRKSLFKELAYDPEFRKEAILPRTVLIRDENGTWNFETRYYYAKHDFGNGADLPSNSQAIGLHGSHDTIRMSVAKNGGKQEKSGIIFHSTPQTEQTIAVFRQYIVKALLAEGEIVLPDQDFKAETPKANSREQTLREILLTIPLSFDPETKTLDLSGLTSKEKQLLAEKLGVKDKNGQPADLVEYFKQDKKNLPKEQQREISSIRGDLEDAVVEARNLKVMSQYLKSPEFKKLKAAFQAWAKAQDPSQYEDLDLTLGFLLNTVLRSQDHNLLPMTQTVLAVTKKPNKQSLPPAYAVLENLDRSLPLGEDCCIMIFTDEDQKATRVDLALSTEKTDTPQILYALYKTKLEQFISTLDPKEDAAAIRLLKENQLAEKEFIKRHYRKGAISTTVTLANKYNRDHS